MMPLSPKRVRRLSMATKITWPLIPKMDLSPNVVTPSGTAQGIVQEGGRENEHTRT